MELSPFKSITGSDTFWDGSIPNPLSVGIPISVSQTTPETSVAGLRNHLTSDLVPNRLVTRVGIPIVSSVTHTFSRPVDTVVSNITAPSFLTGLNVMQHRPPISSIQPSNRFPSWPCPPWTPQFQAHSGFPCDPTYPWSTFPDNPSSNPRLRSDTSSSQTSLAKEVREILGEFKKSLNSDLKVVSDRWYALESRSCAPVESSSPNQCQEEEDDTIYGPRESGGFFSHCRGGSCSYYFCFEEICFFRSEQSWYSQGR